MDDTGESVRSPDQALGKAEAIEAFIERWRDTGGKERANYQLFLTELCQLLDLPGPEPAGKNDDDDAYVFERRVGIHHPTDPPAQASARTQSDARILSSPPAPHFRAQA